MHQKLTEAQSIRRISMAFPPADVDARSSDGLSALAIAEKAGSLEMARALKDAGANDWSDVEYVLGDEILYSAHLTIGTFKLITIQV
eukprot:3639214-Amphidinium_carterae.1